MSAAMRCESCGWFGVATHSVDFGDDEAQFCVCTSCAALVPAGERTRIRPLAEILEAGR